MSHLSNFHMHSNVNHHHHRLFNKFCSYFYLCLIFKWIPSIGAATMEFGANFISFPKCRASSSMRNFCIIDAKPSFVNSFPIRRPIQLRGPSPNGKYGMSINVLSDLFALENLDGSNFAGSG